MVEIAPDLKRNKKLYTGYINYRILADSMNKLKTQYFKGYPKKMVDVYRNLFNNPKLYHCYGEMVVRDRSEEKWI